MRTFKIRSIGFVRILNSEESISELVINDDLKNGLDGVEDFSHLFVLYWMDKLEVSQHIMNVHPWGDESLPLVGIFATRTPYRSNPIGLTLVELLRRDGNILRVKGLDAFHETPIIDIKPFDLWDASEYPKVRVPNWWRIARPKEYSQWLSIIKNVK